MLAFGINDFATSRRRCLTNFFNFSVFEADESITYNSTIAYMNSGVNNGNCFSLCFCRVHGFLRHCKNGNQ